MARPIFAVLPNGALTMPVIPPLVASILEYLGIAAAAGPVLDAAMSAFESSKGDAASVADAAAKAAKMRVTASERRAAAREGMAAAKAAATQAAESKKIWPKIKGYGGLGLTTLFAAPIIMDLFGRMGGGGEESEMQSLLSAQGGMSSPQDLLGLMGGLEEAAARSEGPSKEELGRLRGEVSAVDTMNRMGSQMSTRGVNPFLEELIRGKEEELGRMSLRQQNPTLAETLAMQGLFEPDENNLTRYMS
jgi:hypothetical protein